MVFFIFFRFRKNILKVNSGDPDQTPRSAASGMGLHYLPTSHKKEWVKISPYGEIRCGRTLHTKLFPW